MDIEYERTGGVNGLFMELLTAIILIVVAAVAALAIGFILGQIHRKRYISRMKNTA